jgi:acylphosphatase
VYFRAYAVKKAKSLGVTGWIKNTESDSVIGEAQQQKPKLDEFVKVTSELTFD